MVRGDKIFQDTAATLIYRDRGQPQMRVEG